MMASSNIIGMRVEIIKQKKKKNCLKRSMTEELKEQLNFISKLILIIQCTNIGLI